MITLSQIKQEAELNEGLSISQWYREKIAHLKGYHEHPIPPYINEQTLSDWCDARKIPCLIFIWGWISFADTYSMLYHHEANR